MTIMDDALGDVCVALIIHDGSFGDAVLGDTASADDGCTRSEAADADGLCAAIWAAEGG